VRDIRSGELRKVAFDLPVEKWRIVSQFKSRMERRGVDEEAIAVQVAAKISKAAQLANDAVKFSAGKGEKRGRGGANEHAQIDLVLVSSPGDMMVLKKICGGMLVDLESFHVLMVEILDSLDKDKELVRNLSESELLIVCASIIHYTQCGMDMNAARVNSILKPACSVLCACLATIENAIDHGIAFCALTLALELVMNPRTIPMPSLCRVNLRSNSSRVDLCAVQMDEFNARDSAVDDLLFVGEFLQRIEWKEDSLSTLLGYVKKFRQKHGIESFKANFELQQRNQGGSADENREILRQGTMCSAQVLADAEKAEVIQYTCLKALQNLNLSESSSSIGFSFHHTHSECIHVGEELIRLETSKNIPMDADDEVIIETALANEPLLLLENIECGDILIAVRRLVRLLKRAMDLLKLKSGIWLRSQHEKFLSTLLRLHRMQQVPHGTPTDALPRAMVLTTGVLEDVFALFFGEQMTSEKSRAIARFVASYNLDSSKMTLAITKEQCSGLIAILVLLRDLVMGRTCCNDEHQVMKVDEMMQGVVNLAALFEDSPEDIEERDIWDWTVGTVAMSLLSTLCCDLSWFKFCGLSFVLLQPLMNDLRSRSPFVFCFENKCFSLEDIERLLSALLGEENVNELPPLFKRCGVSVLDALLKSGLAAGQSFRIVKEAIRSMGNEQILAATMQNLCSVLHDPICDLTSEERGHVFDTVARAASDLPWRLLHSQVSLLPTALGLLEISCDILEQSVRCSGEASDSKTLLQDEALTSLARKWMSRIGLVGFDSSIPNVIAMDNINGANLDLVLQCSFVVTANLTKFAESGHARNVLPGCARLLILAMRIMFILRKHFGRTIPKGDDEFNIGEFMIDIHEQVEFLASQSTVDPTEMHFLQMKQTVESVSGILKIPDGEFGKWREPAILTEIVCKTLLAIPPRSFHALSPSLNVFVERSLSFWLAEVENRMVELSKTRLQHNEGSEGDLLMEMALRYKLVPEAYRHSLISRLCNNLTVAVDNSNQLALLVRNMNWIDSGILSQRKCSRLGAAMMGDAVARILPMSGSSDTAVEVTEASSAFVSAQCALLSTLKLIQKMHSNCILGSEQIQVTLAKIHVRAPTEPLASTSWNILARYSNREDLMRATKYQEVAVLIATVDEVVRTQKRGELHTPMAVNAIAFLRGAVETVTPLLQSRTWTLPESGFMLLIAATGIYSKVTDEGGLIRNVLMQLIFNCASAANTQRRLLKKTQQLDCACAGALLVESLRPSSFSETRFKALLELIELDCRSRSFDGEVSNFCAVVVSVLKGLPQIDFFPKQIEEILAVLQRYLPAKVFVGLGCSLLEKCYSSPPTFSTLERFMNRVRIIRGSLVGMIESLKMMQENIQTSGYPSGPMGVGSGESGLLEYDDLLFKQHEEDEDEDEDEGMGCLNEGEGDEEEDDDEEEEEEEDGDEEDEEEEVHEEAVIHGDDDNDDHEEVARNDEESSRSSGEENEDCVEDDEDEEEEEEENARRQGGDGHQYGFSVLEEDEPANERQMDIEEDDDEGLVFMQELDSDDEDQIGGHPPVFDRILGFDQLRDFLSGAPRRIPVPFASGKGHFEAGDASLFQRAAFESPTMPRAQQRGPRPGRSTENQTQQGQRVKGDQKSKKNESNRETALSKFHPLGAGCSIAASSSGTLSSSSLGAVTTNIKNEKSAYGISTSKRTCTFSLTGEKYEDQHWYHCITCNLLDEKGCCVVCARICHDGHELTYARRSRFFCDCGAGSSCASKRPKPIKMDKGFFHVPIGKSLVATSPFNKQQQSAQPRWNFGDAFRRMSPDTIAGNLQMHANDLKKTASGWNTKEIRDLLDSVKQGMHVGRALVWIEKAEANRLASSVSMQATFEELASTVDNLFQIRRRYEGVPVGPSSLTTFRSDVAGSTAQRTGMLPRMDNRSHTAPFSHDRIIATNSSGHIFVAEGTNIRCLNAGALLSRGAKNSHGKTYGWQHDICEDSNMNSINGKNNPPQSHGVVNSSNNIINKQRITESNMVPLYRMSLSYIVRQIEFNPSADHLVAIVGSVNCFVLTLSSKASVQSKMRIELALGLTKFELEGGHSGVILGAVWLPNSKFHLLVASTHWVKVFNVDSDSIYPCFYWEHEVKLCAFEVLPGFKNGNKEIYVADVSGCVYRQKIVFEGEGNKRKTQVVELPWSSPPGAFVNSLHIPPCSITKSSHALLVSYLDGRTCQVVLPNRPEHTGDLSPVSSAPLSSSTDHMCIHWVDWPDQLTEEGSIFSVGLRKGTSDSIVIARQKPMHSTLEVQLLKTDDLIATEAHSQTFITSDVGKNGGVNLGNRNTARRKYANSSSGRGIRIVAMCIWPPPWTSEMGVKRYGFRGDIQYFESMPTLSQFLEESETHTRMDISSSSKIPMSQRVLLVLFDNGRLTKCVPSDLEGAMKQGFDVLAKRNLGSGTLKHSTSPGKHADISMLYKTVPSPFFFENLINVSSSGLLSSCFSWGGHILRHATSAQRAFGMLQANENGPIHVKGTNNEFVLTAQLSCPGFTLAALRVQFSEVKSSSTVPPDHVLIGPFRRKQVLSNTSNARNGAKWHDFPLTPIEVLVANRMGCIDFVIKGPGTATGPGNQQQQQNIQPGFLIESCEAYALETSSELWYEFTHPAWNYIREAVRAVSSSSEELHEPSEISSKEAKILVDETRLRLLRSLTIFPVTLSLENNELLTDCLPKISFAEPAFGCDQARCSPVAFFILQHVFQDKINKEAVGGESHHLAQNYARAFLQYLAPQLDSERIPIQNGGNLSGWSSLIEFLESRVARIWESFQDEIPAEEFLGLLQKIQVHVVNLMDGLKLRFVNLSPDICMEIQSCSLKLVFLYFNFLLKNISLNKCNPGSIKFSQDAVRTLVIRGSEAQSEVFGLFLKQGLLTIHEKLSSSIARASKPRGEGSDESTKKNDKATTKGKSGNSEVILYRCDGCQRIPLYDVRYHCRVCEDFDLCKDCKGKAFGEHLATHDMEELPIEDAQQAIASDFSKNGAINPERALLDAMETSIVSLTCRDSKIDISTQCFAQAILERTLPRIVHRDDDGRRSIELANALLSKLSPLTKEGELMPFVVRPEARKLYMLVMDTRTVAAAWKVKLKRSRTLLAALQEQFSAIVASILTVFERIAEIAQHDNDPHLFRNPGGGDDLNSERVLFSSGGVPTGGWNSGGSKFSVGNLSPKKKHGDKIDSSTGRGSSLGAATVALWGVHIPPTWISSSDGNIDSFFDPKVMLSMLLGALLGLLAQFSFGIRAVPPLESIRNGLMKLMRDPRTSFAQKRFEEALNVLSRRDETVREACNAEAFEFHMTNLKAKISTLDVGLIQKEKFRTNLRMGLMLDLLPSLTFDTIADIVSSLSILCTMARRDAKGWMLFCRRVDFSLQTLLVCLQILPEKGILLILQLFIASIPVETGKENAIGSRNMWLSFIKRDVPFFRELLVDVLLLSHASKTVRVTAAMLWRRIFLLLSAHRTKRHAVPEDGANEFFLVDFISRFSRFPRNGQHGTEAILLLTTLAKNNELWTNPGGPTKAEIAVHGTLTGMACTFVKAFIKQVLEDSGRLRDVQLSNLTRMKGTPMSASEELKRILGRHESRGVVGDGATHMIRPPVSSTGASMSETCPSCSILSESSKEIALRNAKAKLKYTANTMIAQLNGVYALDGVNVNVATQSSAFGCGVSTITVYCNWALRIDPDVASGSWHQLGVLTMSRDKVFRCSASFALPVSTCNLLFEFNTSPELAFSQSNERQICPRCNRTVASKNGICSCGEVVFQCRQCRRINQEDRNAFLCVECGYCRFAKFSFTLEGRSSIDCPKIRTRYEKELAEKRIEALVDRASDLRARLGSMTDKFEAEALTTWGNLGGQSSISLIGGFCLSGSEGFGHGSSNFSSAHNSESSEGMLSSKGRLSAGDLADLLRQKYGQTILRKRGASDLFLRKLGLSSASLARDKSMKKKSDANKAAIRDARTLQGLMTGLTEIEVLEAVFQGREVFAVSESVKKSRDRKKERRSSSSSLAKSQPPGLDPILQTCEFVPEVQNLPGAYVHAVQSLYEKLLSTDRALAGIRGQLAQYSSVEVHEITPPSFPPSVEVDISWRKDPRDDFSPQGTLALLADLESMNDDATVLGLAGTCAGCAAENLEHATRMFGNLVAEKNGGMDVSHAVLESFFDQVFTYGLTVQRTGSEVHLDGGGDALVRIASASPTLAAAVLQRLESYIVFALINSSSTLGIGNWLAGATAVLGRIAINCTDSSIFIRIVCVARLIIRDLDIDLNRTDILECFVVPLAETMERVIDSPSLRNITTAGIYRCSVSDLKSQTVRGDREVAAKIVTRFIRRSRSRIGQFASKREDTGRALENDFTWVWKIIRRVRHGQCSHLMGQFICDVFERAYGFVRTAMIERLLEVAYAMVGEDSERATDNSQSIASIFQLLRDLIANSEVSELVRWAWKGPLLDKLCHMVWSDLKSLREADSSDLQATKTPRNCLLQRLAETLTTLSCLVENPNLLDLLCRRDFWKVLDVHVTLPLLTSLHGSPLQVGAAKWAREIVNSVTCNKLLESTMFSSGAKLLSTYMHHLADDGEIEQGLSQRKYHTACFALRSISRLLLQLGSQSEIVQELPNIFILMHRARSQEDFFSGNLEHNPISIEDVVVGSDEVGCEGPSAGNNVSGPEPGGQEGARVISMKEFAESLDEEVVQSETRSAIARSEREPTLRDLRRKIAHELNFSHAQDIIEFIIAGKLVNVDLTIRLVYEKLWSTHAKQDEEDGDEDIVHVSFVDPDGGSEEKVTRPMEVTYRLMGIDGEATEDFVESLESLNGKEDSEEPEKQFKQTLEFGMVGLRGLLNVVRMCCSKFLLHSADVQNALMAAVKVLKQCCNCSANRKLLISSDLKGIPALLGALMATFREPSAAVVAEQIVFILETLVVELGSSPDENAYQLEQSSSPDATSTQLEVFLQQLDRDRRNAAVRSRKALARLLPFLTFGNEREMDVLLDRFQHGLDLSRFDRFVQRSNEEDEDMMKAESTVEDLRSFQDSIQLALWSIEGMGVDQNSMRFRHAALKAGITTYFAEYLTRGFEVMHSKEEVDVETVQGKKKRKRGSSKKAIEELARKSSTKLALRLLSGLVRGHHEVQLAMRDSGILRIALKLEGIPSKDIPNIGDKAYSFLEAVSLDNEEVQKYLESLREKERSKKRNRALTKKRDILEKMGLHSEQGSDELNLIKKKRSRPDDGDAEGEGLKASTQMTKRKKRKKKKHVAKMETPEWMKGMDNLVNETHCCVVCMEGYAARPTEPLGVYVFAKAIEIEKNLQFVDVQGHFSPERENLIRHLSIENLQEFFDETFSNSLSESLPSVSQRISSAQQQERSLRNENAGAEADMLASGTVAMGRGRMRRAYGNTSVSAFNCIHFSCHEDAVHVDKNNNKARKSEWEGAELRNSMVKCNALLPLRGPLTVTGDRYDSALDKYFEKIQARNMASSSALGPDASSFVLYDMRTMLLRFAFDEPLSSETNGGGRESNLKLIVPFASLVCRLLNHHACTKAQSLLEDFLADTLVRLAQGCEPPRDSFPMIDLPLAIAIAFICYDVGKWTFLRPAFLKAAADFAWINATNRRSVEGSGALPTKKSNTSSSSSTSCRNAPSSGFYEDVCVVGVTDQLPALRLLLLGDELFTFKATSEGADHVIALQELIMKDEAHAIEQMGIIANTFEKETLPKQSPGELLTADDFAKWKKFIDSLKNFK